LKVVHVLAAILRDLEKNPFARSSQSKYHGPIATPEALDALLGDAAFCAAEEFQLVELKLGYLDAPLSLRLATAAVEEFSAATKA
jgi:pyruvate decarboxylase